MKKRFIIILFNSFDLTVLFYNPTFLVFWVIFFQLFGICIEALIIAFVDNIYFSSFLEFLNEFVSRYFASDGYKDGVEGFVLAFLQMFYYFLVYFYYLETKEFKSGEKIKEEEFFRIGLKESLHWKRKKSIKDKLIKKLL